MKKVTNKILQIFLVATLIFTSFTLQHDTDVKAASSKDVEISLNWSEDKKPNYRPGETIYLKGEWSIPDDNHEVKYVEGDTFKIKLPEGINSRLTYIPLKDELGVTLAEGHLEGDEFVFTFTKDIEQKVNRKGGFNFSFTVGTPEEEGKVDLPIRFENEKGQNLFDDTIVVENEKGTVIEKGQDAYYKGAYSTQGKDTLRWYVVINRYNLLGDEQNVTITDVLGPKHEIVPGTFTIRKARLSTAPGWDVDWENDSVTLNPDTVKNLIQISKDLKSFIVELTDIDQYAYEIEYETRYTGNYLEDKNSMDSNGDIELINNLYLKGKTLGEIQPGSEKKDNVFKGKFNLGGWAAGDPNVKGKLKLHKIDGDTGRSLEGVEFSIVHQEGYYSKNLVTDENGVIEIDELPVGLYTITEKSPLEGYKNGESFEVLVSPNKEAKHEYRVINRQKPIEIEAKKVWKDASDENINPLEDVIFELYADGELIRSIPLEKESQTVKFTNLPRLNNEGQEINYEVREKGASDKYDVEVGTKENNYTVTNKIKTRDIEVEKEWLNADGEAMDPIEDIKVSLYKTIQGKKELVETKEITVNDQKVTFENLPVIDNDGNEIIYSVEEEHSGDYEVNIQDTSENKIKIENKIKVNLIDLEVNKKWISADDENPKEITPTSDIEIELLKNGNSTGKTKTLKKGEKSVVFENLEDKDVNGKPYKYTVRELEVENFDPSYDYSKENEVTITNKYVVPTTEIEVTKVWKNLKGETIESHAEIEILLKNKNTGDIVDRGILPQGEEKLTFKNIPVTDKEGNKIEYVLEELDVNGFTSEIEFIDEDYKKGYTATITNTKDVEMTDIKGHKVWFDVSGKKLDASKEQSIIIDLLKDGKVIDSVTLEKGEYDFAFTNLPKTDNKGNEFTYTVKERDLEGFTSHVSYDEKEDLFIISNKKDVEYFDLHGSKTWLGLDGEVMDSAAEITVELYADGELKETIVLAEGEYDFVFENLPLTDEKGQAIKYVVKELPLEGFQSKVEYKDGKILITNMEDVEEVDSVNVEPKDPEEVEEVLEVQVLPQTGQGVSGLVYTGLAGFILGLFLFFKDRKED